MKRTVLYENHKKAGAKLVDFAGWEMPVQYPMGILEEHLMTRREAGLFDVSHMGRFEISGKDALPFLQHVLSNNAAALKELSAQYTMIPNEQGGAVDDAYLYKYYPGSFLLVVNASNTDKDYAHISSFFTKFPGVKVKNITEEMAMIALQGPFSRAILEKLLEQGNLPEPSRNELSVGKIAGAEVLIARTGYTGEPLGFELFIPADKAPAIWDRCVNEGAYPVGLGARDSLRLEAGLPLFGHELGKDPEGKEIPIFACPLAKFAVSFSPIKGDFVGRMALAEQFSEYSRIIKKDRNGSSVLPRIVKPLALRGAGVAREGSAVFKEGKQVGWVTSGTIIPYWLCDGVGLASKFCQDKDRRGIGLALLDNCLEEGDFLDVEVRGKLIPSVLVPYHLRSEAPPYARPALYPEAFKVSSGLPSEINREDIKKDAFNLIKKSLDNTVWRQKQCLNMIPSEQTQSPVTRLLQVMDPAFRYAEHKKVKAFDEAEVFYYQGTDFIDHVESLLVEQMKIFLGCPEVETRVISGQMANTAVFSAMVDYINRDDRRREPRRMRSVMNNHIIRGGHLSAQPMGALRDFISRDPITEKPAVVNFPVLADNPYKIDVKATEELVALHKPELIILGKSMIIHKEPVAELKGILTEVSPGSVLMYDMAHVLGLIGPYFQEPFKEGADIVTGSTHKTFFGTQRGVIGVNARRDKKEWALWEAVERRVFPGSVSNHHLGTLLGLLMAAYEMNYFKDDYQKQVVSNAKALAKALKAEGLSPAGDPALSYTETHQVVLEVGYGKGIDAARNLEENNIIVNFQASPREEGFTASGSLRMGVNELTRFGMKEKDMQDVASLIRRVVTGGEKVKEEVVRLKEKFLELKYCFKESEAEAELRKLL